MWQSIIALEFDSFYLVTVYTPNSGSELKRLDYRQDWDTAFLAYLKNPADREYIEIQSPIDKGISIQVKLVSFGGNQSLLIGFNRKGINHIPPG